MIDENKLLMELRNVFESKKTYTIECTEEDLRRWIENQPKVEKRADCTRRKFYQQGYNGGLNANRWIPCSEELPTDNEISEYYDSVIVTLDNGRVANGCYRNKDEEWWVDAEDGEHYYINATGHVVAWMPLPEQYKPDYV